MFTFSIRTDSIWCLSCDKELKNIYNVMSDENGLSFMFRRNNFATVLLLRWLSSTGTKESYTKLLSGIKKKWEEKLENRFANMSHLSWMHEGGNLVASYT